MIHNGGVDREAEYGCSPERMLLRPWSRLDWLALIGLSATALGVFLAVLRFYGAALMRLAVCERLFQSDGWRVVSDMIDVSGVHYRGTVHPMFCVFTMPITNLMIHLFGTSRIGAILVLNAATAVAWVVLLYVTQRNLDCTRRSSLLICSLAMASAGFLFWFPVPETYPLGSLSLLVCFAVAALARRLPISQSALVAAGVFSFGVTITNWMAGLALAVCFKSPRNVASSVALTLVILLGGWSVQKMVFPYPPKLFLKPGAVQGEVNYMFHPDSGGAKERLRGELLSPVVLPPIRQTRELPSGRALSVQGFSDVLKSPVGTAASLGWMILLGLGVVALARGPAPSRFRRVLGAVLAGQLVLHLIYGEETFLYALHFLPILMLVVAMATLTRWRPLVEILLVPTILLVLWNNLDRLDEIVRTPFHGDDPRLQVLSGPLPKVWNQQMHPTPPASPSVASPPIARE
ncbi:hypothetical protein BSF38_00236 [Paludisphaera borealis]|uniref:Glycosyltransferase RgtA/B/C/D-like domain-containing protein n=2 Tax=Paludisphaera borealis TaxID=1387353 RepID=A0A1U7CIS1_9BACT|nr:hypothetical protein BSF38_00236 [Paludisphaera borealis]